MAMEWVLPGRLARSARPDPAAIEAWLAQARTMGIRSILCLLDNEQLESYQERPGGLLAAYRRAGFTVGHLPIPDYQDPPIPPADLEEVLRLYESLPAPLLIHCWAGIDRTGAAVGAILERQGGEGVP
jgi:protein-tyrosine phosphatase